MTNDYFIGRGGADDYDELMFLLNDTFGFEQSPGFMGMLPKLYKKEYAPWENNIIARVDGKILAAIGLYYNKMKVLGKELNIAGIGNVAVSKAHRGAGYMKSTMNFSLEEMVKRGVDLSYLGGRRHRYMHFSYDKGGYMYYFDINDTSVRHVFGKDKKSVFSCTEVHENDTEILLKIEELYNSQPLSTSRKAASLYDILCSWSGRPYAFFDGDRFAGYIVLNSTRNYAREIYACDDKDYAEMLISALENSQKPEGEDERSICFAIPEHSHALLKAILPFSEGYSYSKCEQFSILNYRNVVEAFLHLKTSYKKLCDGELKVFINGFAREENIKISIKNNKVSVCESEDEPDTKLSHLEAVRFFSSIYSERRDEIDACCASWFPLPVIISEVDGV